MKKLYYVLILFLLVSCSEDKLTVKIIETGEKTIVFNKEGIYVGKDTIQVSYNFYNQKWIIEEYWIPMQEGKQSRAIANRVIYQAVVLKKNN